MSSKGKPKVGLSPDGSIVGGARQQSTNARDAKAYLWAGTIVHVDSETMVCSVRLDSGQGYRHDVPLPAPGGGGPRSWSGVIPEPGSKVILGWKKWDNRGTFAPYIIEFLTPGTFPAREFEPFSSIDPEEAKTIRELYPELGYEPGINTGVVRLKARKGYPGDYLASSSSGSDVILDRDALVTNRAGNELRLRDADQTAVLQTRNEFTQNSAGYYRRGLIKRNAFNFLPDLYRKDPVTGKYADVISPGDPSVLDEDGEPAGKHPAYDVLLEFGLIKEDGSHNFGDPDEPLYPYVVHPDGQRVSYVVPMEQEYGFDLTQIAYVEDRRELRHISDGVMAVTEEGDGFQIDPPFPVFIEDVHGTVVGNDFHSDSGRPLYKRILTMRLFDSPDQAVPSAGPIFEPVDPADKMDEADDIALARLYRILSPNGSNQFCFGVTKEGRTFLHVPKAKAGGPDNKGKSLDVSVAGAMKAVLGMDENNDRTSLDLRMLGGVKLMVGRLANGASVEYELDGAIKRIHHGDKVTGMAEENFIGGSTLTSLSGSAMTKADGSQVFDSGAEHSVSAQRVAMKAGPGGLVMTSSGDYGVTVLGKTQQQYAQSCSITHAVGRTTNVLIGVDSTTVLAGSATRSVLAGAGISDTVAAGNLLQSVAAGNLAMSVGSGSMSATVGAGALTLTAAAGPVSVTSGAAVTVSAAALISLTAPVTKIGLVQVGFAVAGAPGPAAPHLDYLLGIPILGLPTVPVG